MKQKILIIALLLCSFFTGISNAAPLSNDNIKNEPLIRVGLWTGQTSVFVSADDKFSIIDKSNRKTIATYEAKTRVIVSIKAGKIYLDSNKCESNNIEVVLKNYSEDKSIEVNRKNYRGNIEISNNKGLAVINILPLEEYLYSIVAGEMSPSWPQEALKAQAVAARTYALNEINKHVNEGFNVCPTTHCQVYGGKNVEDIRAITAVDDTNGLVLYSNGKLITAVFHSASGGYTENSEEVWGSYLPYLRAVPDYDQNSPNYKWEKKLTALEIQQKIIAAGYNIGKLQAIEISPLKSYGKNSNDRSAVGRIKNISFIGDANTVMLSGAKARTILGLNSTLFDISIVVPADKEIDVNIGQYSKKTIKVNMPDYKLKGLVTDKDNIRRITGRNGEIVDFSGFGWGHGLGLSQWGAKQMAMNANPKDNNYFKTILKHYYQNVEINKLY